MRRFLTVLLLDLAVATMANASLQTNVVTGAAFAYRYDDIGNRQWSREFGTNCAYVANELNQYTNIVRGGVSELSAFDLDGNQTNVVTATGEWAVEYNGENRPVLWRRKSDGATIRMAYDRMGRRVRKNDETFVYDGYLNISQTIWNPTEPVATRPLVWRGTGGNAFYFHDGNKNVVVLVDGLTPFCFRYAPFGRSLDLKNDPWRFSSEFADRDLGLSYYNFRHYSSIVGAWLERELIDGACESRLYGYVCNDSISRFDLLGNAEFGRVDEILRQMKTVYDKLVTAYSEYSRCQETTRNWILNNRSRHLGLVDDKMIHCMASCEIAADCGIMFSVLAGVIKEFGDLMGAYGDLIKGMIDFDFSGYLFELNDSETDMDANMRGIECIKKGSDCECCCREN